MSSRKVALSAAFLALAAGGTAACDNGSSYDDENTYETVYEDSSGYEEPSDTGSDDQDEVTPSGDEVFYCADEDGEIVDEDECDTADGGSSYFLWHSTGYSRGLRPGTTLEGGDFFPANDRNSRKAFKLPAAGKVSNGTVKTNVVGRSSGGSSGVTSGSSGSGLGISGSSGG